MLWNGLPWTEEEDILLLFTSDCGQVSSNMRMFQYVSRLLSELKLFVLALALCIVMFIWVWTRSWPLCDARIFHLPSVVVNSIRL